MHQKSELFPIGILAGKGELPFELARISKSLNGECYLACIDEGIDKVSAQNYSHKFFNIGHVGSIIDYFKSHNIKNIILIGNIDRPDLSSIKVDMLGAFLMTKILKEKFLGDDKLLGVIAKFLEDKGFKIISAKDILALDNKRIELSTLKPLSKQDEVDIELGLSTARTLGQLDIGQAVIIEDGYVLGVEAAEGTDKLIERCASLRKKQQGGVLVKVLKPAQDARLDIPSIGIGTIQKLADFNYNGIAIEMDKVIIIDPPSTFELADKLGIFIKKV